MRSTIRLPFALAAIATVAVLCSSTRADSIEAVKGKHYKLTKRHGPWMIMVASFNKPPGEQPGEGMTPEQAADQLVYELRLHHIPAYAFHQDENQEEVQVMSRRTLTPRNAKVRNWTGGICVLAGNYPANNEKVAQETLKYIKNFRPDFLNDVEAVGPVAPGETIKRAKSGGVFRTLKEKGPLNSAFMTTNPLLSDEDLAIRARDPFILKLNSGGEYSLLQNRARYTIVIATFQGKYYTQLSRELDESKFSIGTALSEAAERAWELCAALRRARSLGYERDYESYVFHDRYASIVTIGSFDSKDDPRIVEIQNMFGAKVTQVKADGTPTIGAEAFTIPRRPVGKEPVKTWIFDPHPELIDVPR